ncbi:MAG TPA: replication-relaxation family protein [Thermoanaerobaculia bacterium]|nr:replication-relaxation family protein [Thermoanaerobaculia bacterium]
MSHPEIRRPRFERSPIRPMVLTSRDLDILRAVHRHRLLRSTHLVALLGGSRQTTLRRLQLLFHHGYLDRPLMQLDWYARGSEPLVYALGNRGAELLEREGGLKRGGIRWEAKKRNVSRVFLHHTLAVAEVMVAFEVACRSREGVRFIPPEEMLALAPEATRRLRLPFRWQVEVREGGKPYRLGVEPDRVFGLEFHGAPENRRRAYFFLEADRGTMPVARKGLGQTSFARKLICYQETWRQGIQRSHLGISNFRVLTVTTNRERVEHLVEACRSLGSGGSGLFLFADRENLARGDILTHEWVNGRGEVVYLVTMTNQLAMASYFFC